MRRGKVACEFTEFSYDTPRNRLVLAALMKGSAMLKSDPNRPLKQRCRELATKLIYSGVSPPRPGTSHELPLVAIRDQDEVQMVRLAQLLLDLSIPNEEDGQLVIPDIIESDSWFYSLFEKAIAGFYKLYLPSEGWEVLTGRRLEWNPNGKSKGLSDLLPSMFTDVELIHKSSDIRLVIDTKFTSILNHREEYNSDKFKSAHLYQLYAYLRTQESVEPRGRRSLGLLLHPSIGVDVDEWMFLPGHTLRLGTVDLSANVEVIRSQLLKFAKDWPEQQDSVRTAA